MASRADDDSQGLLDWYGGVAGSHLAASPRFVHDWLAFGFGWTRWRTAHLPDKDLLPSANTIARTTFDMIGKSFSNPKNMALASIFLPTEIFGALGMRAITAEAISGTTGGAHSEAGFVADAEARGIPETYCSYHKVLMSMAETGVVQPPAVLAACSVACDANNLTFKTLAHKWGVPYVYVDVPYEQDRNACLYVADQLRTLARTAEEATGRTLDRARLGQMVARSQRTLEILDRTLPLRAGKYLRGDMMLEVEELLCSHVAMGSADMELAARQMLVDYAAAPAYEGLNLVWVHTTPFFLPALSRHLDRTPEAQIIATDMAYDQVCPDGFWYDGAEHPYEAMAERLVRTSFNGPSIRRAKRVRYLADKTHADGVVVFCHWGCRQTAGAAQLIRRELEAAGYPTLVLDGDGCERANNMTGQLSTRFEAFLELLHSRRAADAAKEA